MIRNYKLDGYKKSNKYFLMTGVLTYEKKIKQL